MKSITLLAVCILGTMALAGCGAAGPVSATPTGNGNSHISGQAHISGVSPTTSTSSSNSSSISSSPSQLTPGTTSTSQSATMYLTYHNPLYNFSVSYPTTWTESPRPNDGDGRLFTFDTHIPTFSNGGGYESYPKYDAVIAAIGVYNVTNFTFDQAKNRPQNPNITSYHVVKVSNGYEVQETQTKGDTIAYSLVFFNATYQKHLQVVVPNTAPYRKIARAVLQSYKPF